MTKKLSKKSEAKKAYNSLKLNAPTEVEFCDLNQYPLLVVTGCGAENLYFTHKGHKYFCKCL